MACVHNGVDGHGQKGPALVDEEASEVHAAGRWLALKKVEVERTQS